MSRGLLFDFASSSLAALGVLVIVVGTGLVAAAIFHLDNTMAGAVGVGCWYLIRLLLRRYLASQAASEKATTST